MGSPRTIQKDEINKLVEFLDTELRPSHSWSIAEEYPTTFSDQNCRNLFIIEDEDQLLSHAAIRYILLKTPQAVFKIAAIGSVVTSSEHRRQGYSQHLLQICLEKARQEKADFAILWSDLLSFYEKLGFQLVGSELSFLIDDYLPASKDQLIFKEGPNISPEALLKCYAKHSVTSFRTAEDIRKYLQIPDSRIYTAWSQNGQLEAYAIEGKGADLKGYIHEWGGGISKLFALINFIRKKHEGPLTLICPKHSQALIRKMDEMKVSRHEGHLGWIKLLDTDNLIKKIHKHARHLGMAHFQIHQKDKKFLMTIEDTLCELPSEQHLVQLAFGPIPEAFWSNFSETQQKFLKQIFPMNLWIWGWDSI